MFKQIKVLLTIFWVLAAVTNLYAAEWKITAPVVQRG